MKRLLPSLGIPPPLNVLTRLPRRGQDPVRDPATLTPRNRLLITRLERGHIGTVADARAARYAASRLGRRDLERKADRVRGFLSRA